MRWQVWRLSDHVLQEESGEYSWGTDVESVSLADLVFIFLSTRIPFWSSRTSGRLKNAAVLPRGMSQAEWRSLSDLQKVKEDFPNSVNWASGDRPGSRAAIAFRVCNCRAYSHTWSPFRISQAGTWVSTALFIYAIRGWDCLLTHDDTDQGYAMEGVTVPRRRIALVSYFHDEWRSDWGGELIIYAKRKMYSVEQPGSP